MHWLAHVIRKSHTNHILIAQILLINDCPRSFFGFSIIFRYFSTFHSKPFMPGIHWIYFKSRQKVMLQLNVFGSVGMIKFTKKLKIFEQIVPVKVYVNKNGLVTLT